MMAMPNTQLHSSQWMLVFSVCTDDQLAVNIRQSNDTPWIERK
jgi:hypothetical protein